MYRPLGLPHIVRQWKNLQVRELSHDHNTTYDLVGDLGGNLVGDLVGTWVIHNTTPNPLIQWGQCVLDVKLPLVIPP